MEQILKSWIEISSNSKGSDSNWVGLEWLTPEIHPQKSTWTKSTRRNPPIWNPPNPKSTRQNPPSQNLPRVRISGLLCETWILPNESLDRCRLVMVNTNVAFKKKVWLFCHKLVLGNHLHLHSFFSLSDKWGSGNWESNEN